MSKLATLFACLCIAFCNKLDAQNQKIPIEGSRWYQLNNTSSGLSALFDGNLSDKVFTGWGTVLTRYESWYTILDGENIDISSIKMYDGQGAFSSTPMYIYAVTDNFQRVLIGTFTGEAYNTWVGPNPTDPKQFDLTAPVKHIKHIILSSTNGNFPNELEFYGSYTTPKPLSQQKAKNVRLEQQFGVNAFEWNFEEARSPSEIDENRMPAVKSFTAIRHYMDWEKLESTEGGYTFNPTHSGGWNYDAIYERCKAEDIEVLACLKTIPKWMQATYPDSLRDYENVPLRYGKDFSDPLSYIEQAKVGFQFAARYGENKNVNPSLVTVNPATRWASDRPNTVKIGLGLIKYIECENERDKWWKGRKAYQTGREYAANLSAFYDGHKNTMGPGVGVKNADPAMKVVVAGTVDNSTDYLRGMIDWCREFRGYNADGTINLCWDVINYHYYANDGQLSQSGTATRGVAPELSTGAIVAKRFLNASHLYSQDMPVWITETGYDLNQGSPYKAIPIGEKTEAETQADWILRTALLYAREGIDRVFFYQMYDNSGGSPGKFNTMGLINGDFSRRPAADYLYQTNKLMGEYFYRETLNADPIVDRYELNGNPAWVLVVPDEKGRTATYKLTTGTSTVRVFRPTIGADAMTEEVLNTSNGSIELTVTETPLFVLPGETKTASISDAGAIAGPTTVCVNTAAEYSVTQVTGATGYEWTVPAGWQIKSGTNSNTITVIAGAAEGEVGVRPFNDQGYGEASRLAVAPATVPALTTITGPSEVCENSIADYITGSLDGTNYTWAATGTGWGLNSANGTNAVKVSIGTGTGSISVIGTNSCGSSTAVVISVKTQSAALSVGVISGNDAACEGSTQTYNISAVANASSYTWSVPTGWTINSGQGSTQVNVVMGSNSGNIAVTASNACGNTQAQKNVTASAAVAQITNNAGSSATRNVSSDCSYIVAGSEFDAVATSQCGSIGSTSWQLSGASTGSGSGTLAGRTFNAGLTTITWKAVTQSGETTAQTVVTVRDATAPVVQVPADISQSLKGNKCSGSVTAPNPTFYDNCSVMAVTWDMSGSTSASSASSGINYVGSRTFNVGTTYINYYVTDASGNVSSAQFTVTLSNPKCSNNRNAGHPANAINTGAMSLSAYPNPSQNYFNVRIEGSNSSPIDIRVIDMLGRVIEMRKAITPGTVIQFGQNLRAGWYILEAVQGEEKQQVKLIKGEQRG